MVTRFRHIARAVIVQDNNILVARMKGAHSFLPGGGVELGEGAKAALRRELREELGVTTCEIARFLGVVEVLIEEIPEEAYLHEICHLFEVQVEPLDSTKNPQSMESHLEFYWAEFNEASLISHNVLPKQIQDTLPLLYEGRMQWVSSFGEPAFP